MYQRITRPSGKLQCNGTLIYDTETRQAILIDPTDDCSTFLRIAEKEQLKIVALWLTHAHVDHAASTCVASRQLGITPKMHPADQPVYDNIPWLGSMFGLTVSAMDIAPDPIAHGEILEPIAGLPATVLHTPGHTPGGVVFHFPTLQLAIVGDTLFRGSVGRTDLPGGDSAALTRSLREVVYQLPPETVCVPGHGPETTVGYEMKNNPYVRA